MRRIWIVVALLLVCGALYAKKPRVAVLDLEYKARTAHGDWLIGEGVADMLTTSLVKSGKFDVMERKKINALLAEQKLGMSGLTTPESAAKAGKILGVEYIITGSVNEFGQKNESAKAFGLTVNNLTARVAMDIRIIQVETSRISISEKGIGEEFSAGVAIDNPNLLPTDIEFGSKGFDETIIGKATGKAVEDAVKKISSKFDNVPLEGKIIKVLDAKVYINLGKDSGVAIGQIFEITRPGEELIDPDSGESLGSEDEKVGTVKVTEIKDKYCVAEITDGKGSINQNDIAVIKK